MEVRRHPLPCRRDHQPERLDRPGYALVAYQVRQDGALGGGDRRVGHPVGQSGRGATGGQPQADLEREDRPFDAVDRLVEVTPRGDGPEQGSETAVGGLVASSVPVAVEPKVVGHLVAVVGFEVIVGPLDEDPAEIAERVVELGLELVAGRGREFGGAEADDQLSYP
jgi:hypothetical protein